MLGVSNDFIRMSYLKIYISLIRKAQKRDELFSYVEKHHIFPKSVFGKNKLTVNLTPREHYLAHALLYKGAKKRYGPEDFRTKKMRYAWWRLSNGGGKYCNSRLYENLRIEFSKANSGKNSFLYQNRIWLGKKHTPETRRKMRNSALGRVVTLETRRKMTGEGNPMYGKRPWENPKAKNNLFVWKNAQVIYDLWEKNSKPEAYRLATIVKNSNVVEASRSNLIGLCEKFKAGWIPALDSEYLAWNF